MISIENSTYLHRKLNKQPIHQIVPLIPNSESTNICYDFSSNWQNEKKKLFGPIRNLFPFSTVQTEKNSQKKLMRRIGENIWCICYAYTIFESFFQIFLVLSALLQPMFNNHPSGQLIEAVMFLFPDSYTRYGNTGYGVFKIGIQN